MKIKLAIIDNDVEYVERLADNLSKNHQDKIEIYFFPNKEVALKNISDGRDFDIMLMTVDNDFSAQLPNNINYAYIGESKEIDSFNGRPVINKYQKVDSIYEQLVKVNENKPEPVAAPKEVVASKPEPVATPNEVVTSKPEPVATPKEVVTNKSEPVVAPKEVVANKIETPKCYKVAFISPAGGVGVSTVAAAYSIRMAKENKAMYLNFEDFSSTNCFFNAVGKSNFNNIVSVLKDKGSNLSESIDNEIKCSNSSVFFFDSRETVSDDNALTYDEKKILIDELSTKHNFNYIVADMKISLDKDFFKLLCDFDKVVLISDGSVVANAKVQKFLNYINSEKEFDVSQKVNLLYNRYCNNSSSQIASGNVPTIGGINKIDNVNAQVLPVAISNYQILDSIVK